MQLVVRAVSFGIVMLLFATPVMACVMEASSLTVSEGECCKTMPGGCQSSIGQASHKCCRTVSRVPDASAPSGIASASQAHVAIVAAPAGVPAVSMATALAPSPDSSPPGSPPVTHTTLRI